MALFRREVLERTARFRGTLSYCNMVAESAFFAEFPPYVTAKSVFSAENNNFS